MQNKLLYFLALSSFLISCNHKIRMYDQQFDQISQLMYQRADSVLSLLDCIKIDQLSETQYQQYLVLKVRAKDRTHKDISQDTLIFQTVKYFTAKKDYDNAGWACYISGRVCQERNDETGALQWYLDGLKNTEKSGNLLQKGFCENNIGSLYYKKGQLDKANQWFMTAYTTFYNRGTDSITSPLQVKILLSIGTIHLMQKRNNEAYVYYMKAWENAVFNNDNEEKAKILKNISAYMIEIGESEKAKEKLIEAIGLTVDDKTKLKTQISLAYFYLDHGLIDSAKYYAQTAYKLYDNQKMKKKLGGSIFELYAVIEEATNDYKSASDYYKQVIVDLVNRHKEENIQLLAETHAKYNLDSIQRQKELFEKRKTIYQLISIIGVLIIIVILIINRLRHVRHRNKLLESIKAIDTLNKLNINNHDAILRHLDFFKKAALLKDYLSDERGVHDKDLIKKTKCLIAEIDQNLVMQIINSIHNGFSDWLISTYPELIENEICICCLLFAGLDDKEVGVIMDYSMNTIRQSKSNIRKKMYLEYRQNIQKYLLEKFESSQKS